LAGRRSLRLPEDWTRREAKGFGPFVTRQTLCRPDGSIEVWESRRHRKRPPHPTGSTWWAPRAIGWWIGVLFAIGSLCFALGAFPPYADAVGTGYDNLTYFVGSLFFTTAAFLLYCQVVSVRAEPGGERGWRVRALFELQWDRIDWWAAIVQLLGTIFFNVSTGHALSSGLSSASSINHAVWRPDALGSICFLISSWLSWAEVCHGAWAYRPRQYSWWIALLNLAGSIAFGVSAIASKVEPNGDLRSLALTNLGTFVGAVCFLTGALLLLPERTEGVDPPEVGVAHPTAPAPAPG
jgi:hypothetical protein